ncbi:SLBB domain-containing protein [Endozoicomonas sp. G2_2]|uniref:SLBB domain-containing protein n=1 Tax=Gammaproteobacteria TaxID=1236 RepID=UPI001ADA7242|nr:SLBB domain-containing protein [Salinisphaera sp.]MBO9469087.1 SLBB domain-containing protein [Endozoicomonas sp. G2_2]
MLTDYRIVLTVAGLSILLAACAGSPAPNQTAESIAPAPPSVNPSNLPIPSDQPADSSATSSEGVIIGAGDIVQMSMFGQADMNIQGFVSDTGQISLPLLGIVNIGDLTPNAAQTRIETAYREGGYFRDPQISLTLVEHRSQQVSVLGAVNQPGRFSLTSRTTLLDVLAEAGGITARGARSVVLIHAGKDAEMRERIDIDALVAGDSTASVLRAGDTVYVPEAPLFYIYGQVQRPDAYAIRPGMTVIQAISTGGGLTDRGSNSRFAIHRRAPDGTVKTLDGSPTTRVQAGDVIFVKERFF